MAAQTRYGTSTSKQLVFNQYPALHWTWSSLLKRFVVRPWMSLLEYVCKLELISRPRHCVGLCTHTESVRRVYIFADITHINAYKKIAYRRSKTILRLSSHVF